MLKYIIEKSRDVTRVTFGDIYPRTPQRRITAWRAGRLALGRALRKLSRRAAFGPSIASHALLTGYDSTSPYMEQNETKRGAHW